jgi:hypothetical protein
MARELIGGDVLDSLKRELERTERRARVFVPLLPDT